MRTGNREGPVIVAGLVTVVALATATPARTKPTCGPIRNAAAVLAPGATVLLGEMHGTKEVPHFLGDLACLAVQRGIRVRVLLEAPAFENANFASYLASDGSSC